MITGNDPQGTAEDLDTSEDYTAEIEALLDDPDDDLDDAPEVDDDSENEGDEPDQSDDGEEPVADEDDAEPGPDATGDQSDIVVTLSDGRKLNRKQIEAAVQAEAQIKAAYTPKFQEAAAIRRQAEEERQAIAQSKQYFDQIVPLATQVISQLVPPRATEEEYQQDFLAAQAKDRAHQRGMEQYQQLYEAEQQRLQQAEQESQQFISGRKQEMQQRLFERRTDLKTPEAFRKYEGELANTLVSYGFEPTDMVKIVDARLLEVFEDAARYKAIKSNKPKAEAKSRNAPPVAKPGVRTKQNGPQAKVRSDLTSKLRSSGDERYADALIANLID